MVRPLLWVLVLLAVFQVAFRAGRTTVLVDVILASCRCNVVTLTTHTTDLIDIVVDLSGRCAGSTSTRAGGPWLNLAIGCVPLMADLAAEVRDAQRLGAWS